jgi:hypothetical protein
LGGSLTRSRVREDAVGDGLQRREGGLRLGGVRDGDGDALELRLVLFLLGRAIAVEAVGFQHRAHGQARRQRRRQAIGGDDCLAFLRDGAEQRAAGGLGAALGEVGGLAQPDRHHLRQPGAGRPERGGLALAALELRRLQPARNGAAGRLVGLLRQAGERGVLGEREHQGTAARQGGLHEGDVGHGNSGRAYAVSVTP